MLAPMPPVPETLTDDDWELIVPRLADGECVAFLGAGANIMADGTPGLPLGGQVALELVEALTKRKVKDFKKLSELAPYDELAEYGELLRLGLQDLPRVASYVELRRDPAFLMKRLRTILDDGGVEPSPLLRTLARLPFQLIVTTNYDSLMERALDDAGVEYLTVVQPVNGFDDKQQQSLNAKLIDWGDGLVLYKIHGSFRLPEHGGDAQPGEVLVTEEDYIQYLTVATVQDRGLPNAITAKLQTSTILYLGYSLEDWDFRTIFKSLIEPRKRHAQFASFAFQHQPQPHWVKLWSGRHVSIVDMSVVDFATQLEDHAAALLRPAPGDAQS